MFHFIVFLEPDTNQVIEVGVKGFTYMFYKSKPFIVILGIVLIGLLGYLGLNLGLEKSSESSQLIITS